MRGLLVLFALTLGAEASGADARLPAEPPTLCSLGVEPRYSIARTQNIVAEAQVIVRATVLGEVPPSPVAGDGQRPQVVLAVDEVLRGAGVPDTLRFIGNIHDEDAVPPEYVAEIPHRSYLRRLSGGSCMAMTYRQGGEYLLLLQRSEFRGVLDPYWVLLAPTNNEIWGADDPWVRWVRLEIARNPARGS